MKTLRVFSTGRWYHLKRLVFLGLLKLRQRKKRKEKSLKEGNVGYGLSVTDPEKMEESPPLLEHPHVSIRYVSVLQELYIKYATLNSWIRILKSFCNMFIWWNKCTFTWYNIFISLNMFASEICDNHFHSCKHIYCLDGLVFFRTDNIQKQAFND